MWDLKGESSWTTQVIPASLEMKESEYKFKKKKEIYQNCDLLFLHFNDITELCVHMLNGGALIVISSCFST